MRIPADVYEQQVLFGVLTWVLDNPADAASIGRRAAEWVESHCTWPQVAKRYAEFAESVVQGATSAHVRAAHTRPSSEGGSAAELCTYLSRWVVADSESGGYFRTHRDRLVYTLQRIPAGGPQDRILEMGCYMQITPALQPLAEELLAEEA